MANAGSGGLTFAADDITSVFYARLKLVHGADGVNDGDVATGNPLPVRIYLGTTAIVGGAGAVAAGVPRVTLASDDPGVALLTTIDADTGGIITAVQLIDDAIVADDAAFTPATTKVMMAGFEFDDATPDSVNEGDAGAARMSANRSIYVNIRDNAGNERGLNIDASGFLTANINGTVAVASHAVTNAGTFVVQVDGAALTALQLIDDAIFAEDVAAQAADKGIAVLAVRRDADTSLVGTDNDYANLQVDANGYLKVEIFDGGGSHTVDNAGTFAVQVDGSALTALQLIDNIVFVDDAAYTLGTSSGVMIMGFAGTQSVNADDACALACTTAGALRVNVENTLTINSPAVTNAGTFVVQENGSALTALQLIDDVIFVDDAAFTPGTSKVAAIGLQADEASIDSVNEGDIGCPRMTLDRKVIVTTQPHSSGGYSPLKVLDNDETEDEISATACKLYSLYCFNSTNAILYVHLYNLTAASTTVGTSVPVMTIPVPANNDTDGAGVVMTFPDGLEFTTALSIATTTGLADNDAGAPGANAMTLAGAYKN